MIGTLITWIQLAFGFVGPTALELGNSIQMKHVDYLDNLQKSNIMYID